MKHLISLQPFLILFFAAMAVLAGILIKRKSKSVFVFTLSGFIMTLFSLWPLINPNHELTTPFFSYNAKNLGWMTLVLGFGVVVTIFQRTSFQNSSSNHEERCFFLVVAVLGGEIVVSTNHLAFLLIGLKLWFFPICLVFMGKPEKGAQIAQLLKLFVGTEAFIAILCFVVGLIYCRNASLAISEVFAYQPGPLLLGLTGIFLVCQRSEIARTIWKNALSLKQGIRERIN